MNEDYSELSVAGASPTRLRKLIRHLGKAVDSVNSGKQMESRKSFVSKIHEISGKGIPEHSSDDEIKSIEAKLSRLEEIERSTMNLHQREESDIAGIKQKLSAEDSEVGALRTKIELLEKRLSDSEIKRLRQLQDSKEKIGRLTHLLSELSLKIDGVTGASQDAPVDEDISDLKNNLKRLESLHKKMKSSKKYGKSDLKRVEDRIKALKSQM